jgi:hypothetical protein
MAGGSAGACLPILGYSLVGFWPPADAPDPGLLGRAWLLGIIAVGVVVAATGPTGPTDAWLRQRTPAEIWARLPRFAQDWPTLRFGSLGLAVVLAAGLWWPGSPFGALFPEAFDVTFRLFSAATIVVVFIRGDGAARLLRGLAAVILGGCAGILAYTLIGRWPPPSELDPGPIGRVWLAALVAIGLVAVAIGPASPLEAWLRRRGRGAARPPTGPVGGR